MIDLDAKYLQIVKSILRRHVPGCKVLVFGSRVTGTAHQFSDLDLALICDAPIDWHQLEALKDAFSESDLPIMVDALDWHTLSESFRAIVEEHCEVLQSPNSEGAEFE